jgi:transcriptional regulator with XRE-family HTH domain
MTFGSQLRAARKRAKLTQAQAAEIAGIRQTHWSDIENDHVSPTLAFISNIEPEDIENLPGE